MQETNHYNGGYDFDPAMYGGMPPPPPPKKRKTKTALLIVCAVVVYTALLSGLFFWLQRDGIRPEEGTPSTSNGTNATERGEYPPIHTNPSEDGKKPIVNEDYSGEAMTAAELYAQNVDTVVIVQAKTAAGYSTGSGFVIDSVNGYILTNQHVIDSATEIVVSFHSGSSYKAELVGGDEINDVAVLRIEAEGLKHVTIGNSAELAVGEDLLVIGNPLGGLTFTLTRGVVSGKDRTINTGEHSISTFQTDAAINAGNSGGPAFDATGAVVGIASAKYSATDVEGICFCIPINDAMAIAEDLVQYGYVRGRPNLGIAISTSAGYRYEYGANGRPTMVETAQGAQIEQIAENCCAKRAGLQVGDIITKLNDTTITTATQFINVKNRYKAGDTVSLTVYRNGATIRIDVTLDEYVPS